MVGRAPANRLSSWLGTHLPAASTGDQYWEFNGGGNGKNPPCDLVGPTSPCIGADRGHSQPGVWAKDTFGQPDGFRWKGTEDDLAVGGG